MSNKDFLRRWSQRKAEARVIPAAVTELPAVNNPAEEPIDPDLIEKTSESVIAALTSDSDVSVFLRKGVAGWARNAALRRVWAIDPAIRDFVGEARDYGYDWNSPEGVPGFGPILASDNATSVLDNMFSDSPFKESPELKVSRDDAAPPEDMPLPESASTGLDARGNRNAVADDHPGMADAKNEDCAAEREGAFFATREVAYLEVSEKEKMRRHGTAYPV
jgi:hypothetical protein